MDFEVRPVDDDALDQEPEDPLLGVELGGLEPGPELRDQLLGAEGSALGDLPGP